MTHSITNKYSAVFYLPLLIDKSKKWITNKNNEAVQTYVYTFSMVSRAARAGTTFIVNCLKQKIFKASKNF